MRSLLSATAFLAAVAAPASAQAVLLRVGGTVGQANHYVTTVDMFMRGGPMAAMGGDSTQPTTRTTLYLTRTLTNVTGDTLTFTETIDSARMESPAMPQMARMMGGAAQMMQGLTTTTKMDGRARIFEQHVSGGMSGDMGAGRGMGRGGRMGAQNRERPMWILPRQAVRVGDSWQDSLVENGENGAPDSRMVATFRLERLANRGGSRIATVGMNGTMGRGGPEGMQTFELTGEFQIDLDAGRLSSYQMTMNGTIRSRQGEVPMRMILTQQLH